MDPEKLSKIFDALSSEARLRIVILLENGRLCAGAISSRLEMSPSAASQHLRILKAVGLVQSMKCGYHVHYELDRECLKPIEGLIGRLAEAPKGAKCVAGKGHKEACADVRK